MSRRLIAVTVGILFVVQMVTAMVGTSLTEAFVDGDTARAPLTFGVAMMMCSGIAVVGIGLLMYPILKPVNQRLAAWYAVLRIVEFTVSAVCGIYLLIQLQVVPNHMLWVYIPTGIGGLILTYLLYTSRLVPRPVALLGLVGYALFTLGVPLDLLGILNMNEGPGLVLLAPGGLFELVVFPIWLIAKGFSASPTVADATRVTSVGDNLSQRLTQPSRLPAAAALASVGRRALRCAGRSAATAAASRRRVPPPSIRRRVAGSRSRSRPSRTWKPTRTPSAQP